MLNRKPAWRDIREDALYVHDDGQSCRIETQADAKQLRRGDRIFDRDDNYIGVVGFAVGYEVFVGKPKSETGGTDNARI